MSGMFSYDSKFMSTLQVLTDAFILGILWLVCCIPVITAGAASTAFYYAYRKAVCQKMGYALQEFFGSFKSNFKQATKIWLIVLGLGALVLVDCYLLFSYMQSFPVVSALIGIMLILLVALIMWGCFLFPYIARFEVGTKEALKNAAIIMLANLFWAILLVILYATAVIMAFRIPFVGIFMPTIYMYFAIRILERVFSKYIKPEDTETDR